MMETVNGYVCRTCDDVASAKKGADPAKPKDGPNAVRAAEKDETPKAERSPAVSFGGGLAPPQVEKVRAAPYVPGAGFDARI